MNYPFSVAKTALRIISIGLIFSVIISQPANAHDQASYGTRVDDHAPIGVMQDHIHGKGEFMISYRFMHMKMQHNRIGTNSVSPETIATTVSNRFFGSPMQPPTLRVVPVSMTMQMHMLGAMYAPTDWLTLMLMGNYTINEMDHITFMGGMGTTRLGKFTTKSSGFGDTRLSAIVRLIETKNHKLYGNLGFSLPTGSIDETDDILTPMGARPRPRLPYPMQLGSGTFDLRPGVTYKGHDKKLSWGAQYMADIRLGKNDEHYALGDIHNLTAWTSYAWAPWISTSFRLQAEKKGKVDGIDPKIVAPVQTANPDFQGGERIEALFGVNLLGREGHLEGHRLAIEGGLPIYQNLNGPQLESGWRLSIGYQKAF